MMGGSKKQEEGVMGGYKKHCTVKERQGGEVPCRRTLGGVNQNTCTCSPFAFTFLSCLVCLHSLFFPSIFSVFGFHRLLSRDSYLSRVSFLLLCLPFTVSSVVVAFSFFTSFLASFCSF